MAEMSKAEIEAYAERRRQREDEEIKRSDADPIPDVYVQFIRERLAAGDNPNTISGAIEDGLHREAYDWGLFGDGTWRIDTVCRLCGTWASGLCEHRDEATPPVLRREYEAAHPAKEAE